MYAIQHRVEIESTPRQLRDALTTSEGLSKWWTQTNAQPEVGSIAQFAFGDGSHIVRMRVDELSEELVVWTCIEGPWVNHRFHFEFTQHKRGVALRFTHEGWSQTDDFYRHCNTKWGFFLSASLKGWLETGRGTPHPKEPKI